MALAVVITMVLTQFAIVGNAADAATTIRQTMSPYSIAVAPLSSAVNLRSAVFIRSYLRIQAHADIRAAFLCPTPYR